MFECCIDGVVVNLGCIDGCFNGCDDGAALIFGYIECCIDGGYILVVMRSNLIASIDVMSDECVLGRSVHIVHQSFREIGSKSCLYVFIGDISFVKKWH